MKRVCIVEGVRTPFVKAGDAFRDVPVADLGRVVISEILDRKSHDDLTIDSVVFGNIIGPPEASNVARVMALRSGLPSTTAAYTINMNCASGLLAVGQAYDHIVSGRAKAVIAGGCESMSHAPLQFPTSMRDFLSTMMRAKTPLKKLKNLLKLRPKFFKPVITLTQGLTDPVSGMIMGDTAEVLARRYGISRVEQDEFALRSHQRYFAAKERGFFDSHVLPFFVGPNFKTHVDEDIGPRDGLTLEKLAKLRPYFDSRHGTVTVGNSCPITDGAAGLLIMDADYADELGFKPEFFIKGHGYRGLPPEIMGLGPAVSTPIALRNAGVAIDDIEVVEINEAFAAQVIANERVFASPKLFEELTGDSSILKELDPARLNPNGGAIALGHPVGTSGARIVINTIEEMRQRDYTLGLAAICVGGGLGGAMVISREG